MFTSSLVAVTPWLLFKWFVSSFHRFCNDCIRVRAEAEGALRGAAFGTRISRHALTTEEDARA